METEVQQSQASPVDDVLNVPETVKAFGKEYEVKRFSVGQLLQAAEYIAPLSYLAEIFHSADIGLLMQLLVEARKSALGLLSISTQEPVEWLEQQDPIDAYELLAANVERNARYFFDSGNRRRLEAATARIKRAIPATGGVSSTVSPEPDTAH